MVLAICISVLPVLSATPCCVCVDKNTVVISVSTVKFYICSADERFYDSDDSDYMSPSSVDSGDM